MLYKCTYQISKCAKLNEFQTIREVLHKFVPRASKGSDGSREALQRSNRLEPCVQYLCVPLNEFGRILLNQTLIQLWYYKYKINI